MSGSLTWQGKYPTIRDIMRGLVSFRHREAVTVLAAGILAVLVFAVSSAAALAETPAVSGPDPLVATALEALADMGVLAGRDAASFVPEDPVTRGQLAGYLARALGLPGAQTPVFSDVAADDWYAEAVAAMYQAGMVSGSGPSAFSPDQPVTREDATAWVVAALGYRVAKDSDFVVPYRLPQVEQAAWLAGFRDRGLIDAKNVWAVANAFRLGITSGGADGWFFPDFPLSRGQAVLMLYRAFAQPIAAQDSVPEPVEAVSGYPRLSIDSSGPLVSYIESRLAALSYCPGPIDGVYDNRTRDAVMAFQKVERLGRDGVMGESAWERILIAQAPVPHVTADGYRIEVDLTRQVLMLIDNNKVWKIVHVSTGKKGTRTGHFNIGDKIPGTVKLVTLDGYIYYPSYVVSKTAIHGYPSVPPWPASHGCVRVPMWMCEELWYQVPKDTPIDIYYL
jgi:N-acetylmuramoyl-L-alanine amidase